MLDTWRQGRFLDGTAWDGVLPVAVRSILSEHFVSCCMNPLLFPFSFCSILSLSIRDDQNKAIKELLDNKLQKMQIFNNVQLWIE